MLRILFKIVAVAILMLPTSATWAGAGTYHDELEYAQDKTPLMKAAQSKNLKEVMRLIKSGADVNAATTAKCTALMYATQAGNLDMIKALIKAGAKVTHQTESGSSAFVFLSSLPNQDLYEAAKLFLEAGADVDAYASSTASNINPSPPLLIAAARGNTDLMKMLLKRGASPYTEDFQSRSVISNAMWNGQAEAVRILYEHGVDIGDVFKSDAWAGWPPVKYARNQGHHEAVYVAYRAKAGKNPLEADKLDFDSFVDLMYRDNKVHLRYERKTIKKVLESFDTSQLRKLRNAIFARHNYAFKSEDLQVYFSEKYPAYSAKSKKVKLSYAEKDNVTFIRDIENSKK